MMYTDDCMKKFCELLGEHAMKIFNKKKKKMELLTNEQQESCLKHKKYRKVREHCHYTRKHREAAHRICNLKYSVL